MDDLDRANIVNVEGLAFSTPGLHVGRQGNNIIVTLRGIGTENASITGEPGVAFHVDGVNYARPAAAQAAFFDLERVEVLRGPQGTRGGKGTSSGWIQLVTRKPQNEFELDADYQIGSFNQRRLRSAINIPLNEYARTRFAFYYEDRDGYQDNLFLNDDDRDAFDSDVFGARAHLDLQFTPSLQLLSSFNYYKQAGVGPLGELLPQEPRVRCGLGSTFVTQLTTPLACPIVTKTRALEDTINTSNQLRSDFGRRQDNEFWGVTETLSYETPTLPLLGETELKLIGGFQSTEVSFAQDFDNTEVDFSVLSVPRQNSKQYSGEAQWLSLGNDRFDWQLSAFFQREASDEDLTLTSFDARFLTDTTGAIVPGSVEDALTSASQSAESKSYGLALHTDWFITDSTTLGLGARYSKDTKRASLLRVNPDQSTQPGRLFSCERPDEVDVNPIDFFPDQGLVWCKKGFRKLTGGARLEHRLGASNLLYARIDRGYRPGGFRALAFGDFDAEFNWAYALGSKNQFFDERLTLNLEAFYYDYDDLQLIVRDGLSQLFENGDAEVYGVDLEADFEPLAGLRFESSVGYLHSELTDYDSLDPTERFVDAQGNVRVLAELRDQCTRDLTLCPFLPDAPGDPLLMTDCFGPGAATAVGPPCKFSSYPTSDFSGNQLSRSPEWKIRLALEYSFDLAGIGLGARGSLTPRVQYYWQSESFYRAFNTETDRQSHYHQTDVKLTWRSPSESIYLEFFVDNLEDVEVFQNVLVGDRSQGSPHIAWYDSPRTWGIRAGFRY